MQIKIRPEQLNVKCCYTLLSPVSHHDANIGRDANMSLYNRQLVRLPYEKSDAPVDSGITENISVKFPIPVEAFPIFADEPFERFVGIALIKVFLDRYGRSHDDGDWGTGIFTGIEAYRRLSDRMELSSPRSANLKEFWSILLRDMQCGPVSDESALFDLLSIPIIFHHEVLFHLEKYSVMIVEMARHWRISEQCMNAEYAVKSKMQQSSGEVKTIDFSIADDSEVCEKSVAIPCHSGNDIRHDIRYAGMIHMFNVLDLDLSTQLPTSVKALLENGGNISKGRSAPSTAYQLTQIIREKYPIIGLLGGCTDSMILGDSNLHSVSAFWYGREFNDALEHIFGVYAEHSVIDMLDKWTLHRHVGRYDGSPMPYSFETISAGAKLFVSFQFSPYITELEMGAFWAALHTYQNVDGSIGGQSGKGFGKVKVDLLDCDIDMLQTAESKYEEYLASNSLELSEGLKTGELGCGQVVCS